MLVISPSILYNAILGVIALVAIFFFGWFLIFAIRRKPGSFILLVFSLFTFVIFVFMGVKFGVFKLEEWINV